VNGPATFLPRTVLVRNLEDTHGEHLTGGGLQNAQHVIEVWTSDTSGSKHLIAILALIALAVQAQAQPVSCRLRALLVQELEEIHGERLTGGGLQNATNAIEVWSSAETGSFTVFLTRADGLSCIVVTGQNWHNSVPPT